MKKFLFFISVFVMSMVIMPNVYAEEAGGTADLTRLLESDAPTIELKQGVDYTGNFAIKSDVTIDGKGATINGSITINNGKNVNISNLTMTGSSSNEYIAVNAGNVILKVSNVKIYYENMENSSNFIAAGTGIVVHKSVGDGSEVTITDSVIHTKYAVWIEGSDSNLTVRNSELSGYAAVDLTSSSERTSNNKVIIDHSTLTGYAIGDSTDSNDYGTIVIGNKDDVTIDIINNSVITNNFENGTSARSDLILISDFENKLAKKVEVSVSNSTLKNTAINNDLGAVYNANNTNDNSFETQNTTITGNLIAGAKDQFYVDFVVDGKSNVVLVKNGKLDPSSIPNVSKAGYTFDGWVDENDKPFDTTKDVTKNMRVIAKFTKLSASEVVENPPTSDNAVMYIILAILGLTGLTITAKIFFKNN